MKEKIRSLVNNTYIVHAILILSMTQSLSLIKLFWLGGFIKDGSFVEFLTIMWTVLVSIMAIVAVICLSMEDDGKGKKTKKEHLLCSLMYLVAIGIMMWLIYCITGGKPDETVMLISTNTSHIYDIIFNKTLYIIDMILILAIYMSRKLYKIWYFLLQVLVFKIMFMIGIYFAFVSYLNIFNGMVDRSPSAYLPVSFLCQDTYVKSTNIFFVENVDCPYKGKEDIQKELAKSGSAVAYALTIRKPMDIKEKAAIAIMFYESNKRFEETTWIEKNLPSVYQTSMLYTSKTFYQKNKDAEVMVAKMILSGQETAAIEKAKELLAENKAKKENRSQYSLLYNIVNPQNK
jgi:hypothetical protein